MKKNQLKTKDKKLRVYIVKSLLVCLAGCLFLLVINVRTYAFSNKEMQVIQHYNNGIEYYKTGKYQMAKEEFSMVLIKDPFGRYRDNVEAYLKDISRLLDASTKKRELQTKMAELKLAQQAKKLRSDLLGYKRKELKEKTTAVKRIDIPDDMKISPMVRKEKLVSQAEDLFYEMALIEKVESLEEDLMVLAKIKDELSKTTVEKQKIEQQLMDAREKLARREMNAIEFQRKIKNELRDKYEKSASEISEKFREEKNKFISDIEKITNTLKEVEKERDKFREENKKLKNKLIKITKKKEELDKKTKDVRKKIKKLRSENELYSSRQSDIDKKLASLRRQLIKAEREASDYKKELYRLKEKTDRERLSMYYNLGVVYDTNMMYKEAVEEYKKALSIDPDDADTHYNLAIIYDDHINDNKQAVFHYKKYLELNPEGQDTVKVREWLFRAAAEIKE